MVRDFSLFKGAACLAFCVGLISAADNATKPASQEHTAKDPRLTYIATPLSFEPNVGQSDSKAQFLTRGPGYSAQLSPSQAKFEFPSKDREANPRSITMDLVNGKTTSPLQGESPLPGKANYFPGPDKTKWRSNIPTYSRIKESGVYPGIDLAFYGNQKHLEYDFLLQPNADPNQIRMRLSGSDKADINQSGDLKLAVGDQSLTLRKPVVYQFAADGKTYQSVDASYQLDRKSNEVRFTVGNYDHSRVLVIDPVLSYSEYLDNYASSIASDSSGNTYVSNGYYYTGGFGVTKYSPTGTVLYDTQVGSGYTLSLGLAVDSSGKAYVAGVCGSNATLPFGSNSYSSSAGCANYQDFFVQISADGSSVPYATFIEGANSYYSDLGIAVDSSSNVYIASTLIGTNFTTTTGAYQTTTTASQTGFVMKFNPSLSGNASLIYSTFLGPVAGNNTLNAIAVDSSGNAYVTGNSPSGYPVTAGAFQYNGYYAGSGGVYVTKLNPSGTAISYSAYLGYGTGYAVAVDGQGDAYVTGNVSYEDFPTTASAYQTSYPGGFVTELNPAGSAEVYSTFLGGPSSYTGANVNPYSIVVTPGCSSACNAYISGYTTTTDFPAISAIQTTPSSINRSAFIVELAGNGQSALFSSYLSGATSGISPPDFDNFGKTPALAVDSSGNISVIGNVYGTSDFPVNISTTNPTYGFIAKISQSSGASVFGQPYSINFSNQPVGVSTSVAGGTATARFSNYGSAAATISAIQVTPGSLFSQTNNCGSTLAAGSFCTVDIDFTPGSAGVRSGKLTIASNSPVSPTSIGLTGTGVDQPYLQPSSTGLTFASQNVSTSSTAQSITFTNIGTLSGQPTISFATGTDFTQQNGCNSQIAPGASCTISVTFTPTLAGLRQDILYVNLYGYGNVLNVPITGTGTLSGATSSLTLSTNALAFAPQTVGTLASNTELVYLTNTGTEPINIQSIVTSGDYSLGSNACPTPYQLNPQTNCYVYVNFTPTAAGTRTGNLTFTDSATGSPQTVTLTGTGLASTENVAIYPSVAVSFPDQPVGTAGSQQVIYFENTGTSPINVDRVLITGDFYVSSNPNCAGATVAGTTDDGTGSYSYCYIYVNFAPTATGARTGTLTFVDSAPGSPHTVSLTGNGIAATGTLALNPTATSFSAQAVGTTSGIAYIYIQNPGNSAVTITSEAASGDFSIAYYNCTPSYSVSPNQTGCYAAVQFTPSATGTRSGTFTVQSSAGTFTGSLTGTGVAATSTVQLTPSSSMTFGSQTVSAQGPGETVILQNTGSIPVTFSAATALSGTNAGDFSLGYDYCYNYYSSNGLAPGASCSIVIYFTPSATGSRTATLTFTDSATSATQTVTLTGTGVPSTPTYTLSTNYLTYGAQVQGTTSSLNQYVYFYNNGPATVTLGNLAVTGNFILPNGYSNCNGQTLSANGGSCYVYVQYAPPVRSPAGNGVDTGVLTFSNSASATLLSLPLAGYSLAPAYTSYLSPTTLDFTAFQVTGTSSPSPQIIYLYNTGNTPLTVGTLTGTNAVVGSSTTGEFSVGSGNCGGGNTVAAGSSCYLYFYFTPSATGSRTGSVTFPVTYSNNSTANLTATLSGTGVAEKNSAVLSPLTASFPDQAVGTNNQNTYVTVYLTNSGNQPFTVSTLTGVNAIVGSTTTGEFSIGSGNCGGGGIVNVGSSCYLNVYFTPSATGTRTGSITFPVTFADHTTANPVLSLIGTGTTVTKTVTLSTNAIAFGTEVQTQTTGEGNVVMTNTGNSILSIGSDSITTNSAEFTIGYDSCSGRTSFYPNQTCQVQVTFTPSASATGNQSGVLTIGDNATGGPHTVALTGVAIPASQQIVVAPTSLNFGNQPVSTTSSVQQVYITNQGSVNATGASIVLGGANAADFQLTIYNGSPATCYYLQYQTYFLAGNACAITVAFSPLATSSGTRTATLTETDSLTGSPRTIMLTGNAVTAGPAAGIYPTTLSFPTQSVGTISSAQAFSVKNTGSANLIISNVSSSNSTEFPISADGCSGDTLTPGQQCSVSVKFNPTLGGTRTSTISVADNVTGSPQTLTVTGLGLGIPQATPGVSTLTYSSQNIGSTSTGQGVIVSNNGTDTLNISNIAITGANAGDFAIFAKTCGATLAANGNCSVTITFTPTAAGTRGASLTLTDNANNAPGSMQTVTLTGTGVAVPTAVVNPTALTFPSTNIGVASSPMTSTITNNGTGPLTITSITIGGSTSSGDFTQTNTCGATLVSGSNCTISVTFKPSAAGTRTGTITISDNGSGSTQTISLSGTGAGVPSAAVSPTSLTFSNQNINTTSTAQTITLSNSGTAALTISSIAINSSSFATTNNCAGSVAAGGSCTISVTFTPASAGSLSGTLTVTDNANNAAGSTQTVALTGTGAATPTASVSPAALSFPSTLLGSSSGPSAVTVSNTGSGPLSISNILISSGNSGDFAESSSCGGTLAAGASCSISVTFTPGAAGSRMSTLYITDNSSTGSSQTVTLSGTGVTPAPSAGLTPNTVAFSTTMEATTSAAKTVTLSNSGTAAMAIASIAIGGTNPADFAETNNCGSALAVAASCTISVTFTPAGAASYTASLIVTDNSGNIAGSTQTVALSGTGVASSTPSVASLTPASGTGFTQTFTAVYSDPLGTSDLQMVYLLFNTAVSGANACYVQYNPATNNLYLNDNAGDGGLSAALTPGSSSSVSNSQCTLSGSGSSVSKSGNNLSVTYNITFASGFAGAKNAYLYAGGSGGGSGFVQKGTWTVGEGTAAAVSLTPSSGTGVSQAFTAVYADPNGVADLQTLHLLFNTSVTPGNGCWVQYYPAQNALYLENTAGNGATVALTPGSSSSVSNSQCTLYGTGSSVTASGNSLTLTAAITFSSGFAGAKNVYLDAVGSANSSGWMQEGTWTVGTGTPSTVSLTPSSGTGLTQAFTAVYSDPNGAADLQTVYLLFNTAINGANACYVQYSVATNSLYLNNNGGTGLSAAVTPGSAATVSNSQCSLSGTGSSVTTSFNNVSVTYNITFASAFAGTQNAYMYAGGASSNSGWSQKGTWTVASTNPGPVSLTPNSGTGLAQTFSAVYTDPNGVSDLQTVYLLFNAAVNGANACYVQYSPASNSLYLNNNAGTALSAAVTPGSAVSVSNSQCTLSGAGSSVSTSGNSLTVNYAITFASGFAGTQNAYMYAAGSSASSGWVQEGTWTVGSGTPSTPSLTPSAGTGLAQTFAVVYSDPNGSADLQTVYMLINSSLSGANACYVQYSVATNSLYLNDNAGDGGLSVAVTPGSSSSVSNGQCTLSGAGSSVTTSFNSVTVNYSLTFASGFAGAKNVYLYAAGSASGSGFMQKGTWTVGTPILGPVSLSPSSGTGLTQAFTAAYADPNGTSDLQTVYLLFNTSINGANACYVQYSPATNSLYLNNDAGTGLSAAVTPGSSASVSNSQCTLSGTGSSVTTSGDNLAVTFNVTFASGFTGSKNAYMYAASGSGGSGWTQEGTWTP